MKMVMEDLTRELSKLAMDNAQITTTVNGRYGHGNVRTRVRYDGNIVASIHYRGDINKATRDDKSIEENYVKYMMEESEFWTEVPEVTITNLTKLPSIVGRVVSSTLRESIAVSGIVTAIFEKYGRKRAFMRKSIANSGGTGVELAVFFDDEEGLHIYECAINLYYKLYQDDPQA